MLAALLALAEPGVPHRTTAQELLGRFGSLDRVLWASNEALAAAPGVSPRLAHMLRLVAAATAYRGRAELARRPLLDNLPRIVGHLQRTDAEMPAHALRVLYLDAGCRLLADELTRAEAAGLVSVQPQVVLRRALELDAHSLVLAHSCAGRPRIVEAHSRMTLDLARRALAIRVRVEDHVILGSRARWASLACSGRM